MRKSTVISGMFIALVLFTMITTSMVSTSNQDNYEYLFVFYIPRGHLDDLLSVATNKLNVTTLRLQQEHIDNPDYYLTWLLTGRKPSDLNTCIFNTTVDQERISYIWSNSALIDIPIVDPRLHNYTINPVFNFEQNHLAPDIVVIPVNGSSYLNTLNTTIKATVSGEMLELTLDSYNATIKTENMNTNRSLGPLTITIDRSENIVEKYSMVFYIVEYNESHVKILFPGSIKTSDYTSETIGEITDVTTHWYMLVKYQELTTQLPKEAIQWWINNTIDTSMTMIQQSIKRLNNTINLIYIPHVFIARRLLDNHEARIIEVHLYEKIIDTLKKSTSQLKTNYLSIFLLVGEDNVAVYGSNTMPLSGVVDIDISISQYIASILSLSNANPISLHVDPLMKQQLSYLNTTIQNLQDKLKNTNDTLSQIIDKLNKCESARDLAEYKLANIENQRRDIESLLNNVQRYFYTGLAVSLAVSIILGFLALKVASRKTTR